MWEKFFFSRGQAVNRFKVAEKKLLVYSGNLLKCYWNSWMVLDKWLKWLKLLKLFSCLNIHFTVSSKMQYYRLAGKTVVSYSAGMFFNVFAKLILAKKEGKEKKIFFCVCCRVQAKKIATLYFIRCITNRSYYTPKIHHLFPPQQQADVL